MFRQLFIQNKFEFSIDFSKDLYQWNVFLTMFLYFNTLNITITESQLHKSFQFNVGDDWQIFDCIK